MCRRVALVRTDVAEERIAPIIRVKRISSMRELQFIVTADGVPSSLILFTLIMGVISFSETSVLTRTTRRHKTGDGILHSHRRKNLNCRKYFLVFLTLFLIMLGKHIKRESSRFLSHSFSFMAQLTSTLLKIRSVQNKSLN
jgi:hypothetical protein